MGAACRVLGAANLRDVGVWSAVLLGLVIAGGLVIFALRKWLRDPGVDAGEALDLSELRRMVDEGTMSVQEFEAARAAIVARHGDTGRGATVSPLDPTRLRARPGVDLTGQALPRAGTEDGGPAPSGEGPKN